MVHALLWANMALWALVPFSPEGAGAGFAVAAVAGRRTRPGAVAVVGLVLVLGRLIVPEVPWIGALALGVGAAGALVRWAGWPGFAVPAGRLGGREVLASLGFTALASGALVAWWLVVRPPFDDLTAMLPSWPWPALIVLGLAFAIANAALEELLFRGLLFDALQRDGGLSEWATVGAQAAVFGLLHLHGFPRGWAGVGLAVIYGLMMGALRVWAGGLLAPWLGHVLVNAGMFASVALLAASAG